jgi:hypothetical protein
VTPNTILGRTSEGTGSVEEIATTGNGNVALSESQLYQEYCKAPTAPLSTNTDQIATTALYWLMSLIPLWFCCYQILFRLPRLLMF